MTEYHFLALSSTTEYQFLQLRFVSCLLAEWSTGLADSVSFLCLPHSEFLGTSVSVRSGSWSRWITNLSSAAGAPRRTSKPGICTIRYPPLQEGTHGASFSPALCCQWECSRSLQQSIWIFFPSLEECAWINMGPGIYGQVQEITFCFLKIIHCTSWVFLASMLRAV